MHLWKMALSALLLAGCSAELDERLGTPTTPVPEAAVAARPPPPVVVVAGTPTPPRWIGVSPESDAVLASGGDTYVGIWLEVPEGEPAGARAPMDLALVVDTSGSMQGQK